LIPSLERKLPEDYARLTIYQTNEEQEQHQALRELDELSTLLEFISDDLESLRPHGDKLDA
jgi:hypothetical protein